MINSFLFFNHLVSAIIILLTISVTFCFLYTYRYLHYVHYVEAANDDDGINDLAKYLARHTGGRYIDVDDLWKEFLPAAKAIRMNYCQKKRQSLIIKM